MKFLSELYQLRVGLSKKIWPTHSSQRKSKRSVWLNHKVEIETLTLHVHRIYTSSLPK